MANTEPWPPADDSGGSKPPGPPRYVLRLYVAGLTPASTAALTRLKALCEEYLRGRYDLEVIDIYQQPERAAEAQIVAVPTLVRVLPLPLRKFIGDLSDKDHLIVSLGVQGDNP